MSEDKTRKLFRNKDGDIKNILSHLEGISYIENPLDFFILLARYKFAIRFLKRTDHVIDVGCGHGVGSVFLSRYAEKVTGIDHDLDLINHCEKEYTKIQNLDFMQMDILKLKSNITKYDAVVSLDVIEHFNREDADLVVKNYKALLKEDGFALIGTPSKNSSKFASQRRKETHPYEYAPNEFSALLEKYFSRIFLFSMTDEVISTSFPNLAWYLMAICV